MIFRIFKKTMLFFIDLYKMLSIIKNILKKGERYMKFKKVMSLMAVSSMLVACGGGTGGSSATELKDGDTIKIGFVGPLTGETSTYGIPVKNTIELAIEDYNNSEGAKYKVELLAEDSQGKETDAVNAYKKEVGE